MTKPVPLHNTNTLLARSLEITVGFFSILHWALLLSPIGFPVFAVAIITSKTAVGRQTYMHWTLALLALVGGIAILVFATDVVTIGILPVLATYTFWFFYVRRLTGRVLDAGYNKAVAFLSMIPLVNLICMIVLLFVPSKDGQMDE